MSAGEGKKYSLSYKKIISILLFVCVRECVCVCVVVCKHVFGWDCECVCVVVCMNDLCETVSKCVCMSQ